MWCMLVASRCGSERGGEGEGRREGGRVATTGGQEVAKLEMQLLT